MSPTTDPPGVRTVRAAGQPDPVGGRLELFGVPVWTLRLDIDPESLAHLLDDIDRQLSTYRLPDVPGQQTGSVMGLRTEPWWIDYHQALITATDLLAAELRPGWSERFWRSWGLRFECFADYRSGTWWIHCHQPATYSCVVVLSEPSHLEGANEGATQLRNPQANLDGITGVERDWWGPAGGLTGLIFPGPLEHHPAIPPSSTDRWVAARTLIVTDVCYY